MAGNCFLGFCGRRALHSSLVLSGFGRGRVCQYLWHSPSPRLPEIQRNHPITIVKLSRRKFFVIATCIIFVIEILLILFLHSLHVFLLTNQFWYWRGVCRGSSIEVPGTDYKTVMVSKKQLIIWESKSILWLYLNIKSNV
jgi:hypothetical protein